MPENKQPPNASALRRRAEKTLGESRGGLSPPESGADQLRLLHELQVHQIELEMQNAELCQAKDDLEALLDKYADLYDFSPVGYLALDRDGKILSANLTGARFLGCERSRLLGRDFHDFVMAEGQSDCRAFLEKSFSLATKQATELELQQSTPARFFVQIEAQVAASGQECRLALIDVNERKRTEEILLRNSKLESLGLMAGRIAHDFNNLLAAILGNLCLAQVHINNPQKLTNRLAEAEAAATRAKDLTMQLLTFASGGAPVKKPIYLRSLLREAVLLANQSSSVSCEFVMADDLWPVTADEGQISQVIHNLTINAVQAMPQGGTLTVRARNTDLPAAGKRCVDIEIGDSGAGIPAHLQAKIFDPYYTTRQGGSGLGLATCHAILSKHGGSISLESTPGEGTVFHIRLPAAEQGAVPEPFRETELHPGQGRILVMDDDAAICTIAQASLEELGYSVECTDDGRAAIDLYRRGTAEGNPFAAVILDLTVPAGMGGKEAIALLRQIDPQVKAIVSSGYSSDPVMADYRHYGFAAALRKPYRLAELSKLLRDLLTS
jgi:PAS domain S-box-containing protein